MLVLPADPGLCKVSFCGRKSFGESEKLYLFSAAEAINGRTAYPGAYSALEAITDEPQNITSQVRQLILP
ncbi:hypothetical protein Tco_0390264 [Tanacetum coccineum]